jgi:hypothetical protein
VSASRRKRSLENPRRKCEDSIKIDLREISRGSIEWIDMGQESGQWRAHVNTVMNLWVP